MIRYDVYANGIFDHSLVGGGFTILYGLPGVSNTYTVIAVDSAGNPSVPATLTTPRGRRQVEGEGIIPASESPASLPQSTFRDESERE